MTNIENGWIEKQFPLPLSDSSKTAYECVQCHTHWDTRTNFCPHCGHDKTKHANAENKIWTHDEAARVVDMLEEVLSRYDIHVPSPEDDEREEDNMVGLYGSTYSELFDEVEAYLIDLIEKVQKPYELIKYEFSGTY